MTSFKSYYIILIFIMPYNFNSHWTIELWTPFSNSMSSMIFKIFLVAHACRGDFNITKQEFKYCLQRHTCAKGDIRGLMPPSRSNWLIVHAILSSLVEKSPLQSQRKETKTRIYKSSRKHVVSQFIESTNFKVSPPKIAARNRPSGFSANWHCKKLKQISVPVNRELMFTIKRKLLVNEKS